MKRAFVIAGGILLGLIGLVAAAVFMFTNTDFGRERVRRFVVSKLNGVAHGVVRVGGLDGNLLHGITLSDVSITDSSGAPFLTAQAVSTRYVLGDFLKKRIVLSDLRLVRPVIVLDRPPGGADWNYARIFPSDTLGPKSTTNGFGSWIALNDVSLTDGRIMVRAPWAPSDSLAGPARDSAIALALGSENRNRIERVANGFQKVMDFRQVTGRFPRVRIADPDSAEMLIAVGSARLIAEPFRPPAADVRDVAGTFLIAKDSLYWRGVRAVLADSRVTALDGTYFLDPGDMWIRLHGERIALTDVRWLYPRLPSDGLGSLDLAMAIVGDSSDYVARNIDLRIGEATLAGDLGISMADTVRFRDTNLRVGRLGTRLIEQLVPNLELPRRGTLDGRIALSGSPAALRVDGDIAFDDTRSGTSRIAAVGEVGFASGFRARALRVRAYPVQVDLARIGVPDLPIGGTISGIATLDGSPERWLFGRADMVHLDRGARSHIIGGGEFRLGAQKSMDVNVRTAPLSLATVGRFVPALGLQGAASGDIRARGAFDRLAISGDLRLPDGGRFRTDGTVDIASKEIGYDLTTAVELFDLSTVVGTLPRTSLTAHASASGRGFDPATMRAAIAADLSRSDLDSVAVDSVHARVEIADGLARVDSLYAGTTFARVNVNGTFGLAAGHDGELTYRVELDSLSGLRRWIPSDTGNVAPRPGRQAKILAQARADSAYIARKTEVARAATGVPGPKLQADSVPPIPRDSLAGSLYAVGTVRGSIKGFNVRGRAGAQDVIALGNSVRTGRMEYAVMDGGTPRMSIAAGASLAQLQAAGFALDSAELRVGYLDPDGRIELSVRQSETQDFVLKADFSLQLDQRELRFADLRVRFDTATWASTRPGAIRWGPRGIVVDTIELRNGSTGRIYANGTLPTAGALDLEVAVEGFQIENLVSLIQGELAATGIVSLAARAGGSREAPTLRGALGVTGASYRGTAVPDLRATFGYADAALTAHGDAVRGGGVPLATVDVRLPVNLAMAGYSGPRFLDAPLTVDVVADSFPLDVLPKFTDAVADISGRVIGKVAIRGTKARPVMAGALALDLGRMRLVSTGVTLRDINGSVRLLGDTVVLDSIVAFSGGGHGGSSRVRGKLNIADVANMRFDSIRIDTQDALVLDNDLGRIHADAGIVIDGPFDAVHITGRADVRHGVLYIPKPDQTTAVSPSDPAVFSVIDTSVVGNREIVPAESPLLQNLRVDVALHISTGTFARSSDANIEIHTPDDVGDLKVHVDRRQSAITLEGMVSTERGEYTVAGRRFEISRGSVMFIGTPELDPLLQLIGEREIEFPGREALEIRVVIGGTARHPRLTLESNSQPPISQSDILSYLAFGRSSSSLLQSQGSSLSGQSSGSGGLVGNVAALATRQLAAVAMGAALQEFQRDAARSIGADVFNITPADVPPELIRGSGVGAFLKGTEVEAGRYVNTRTFLGVQARPALAAPGLRFEHRMKKGLRIEASFEPRFLLREPTLAATDPGSATSVFGAFLVLERRF
ncbi:MAG: translocation/assembly module TamB domain-containing protein [Gemmatimonadaceae bacterium]